MRISRKRRGVIVTSGSSQFTKSCLAVIVFGSLLGCSWGRSGKLSGGRGSSAQHGGSESLVIATTGEEIQKNQEPDAFGQRFDPSRSLQFSETEGLVWKRYRAVERTLMRALALPQAEICNELGSFPCIDNVFLTPLGGNSAIERGQYVPAERPTVTTPIALDRVVLSACIRRAELDKQAGAGNEVVFKHIPLSSAILETGNAVVRQKIDAQVSELFRGILSREPLGDEQEILAGLAQGMTGEDFAKSACYVIGTSVEFLYL